MSGADSFRLPSHETSVSLLLDSIFSLCDTFLQAKKAAKVAGQRSLQLAVQIF